MEEDTKEVLKQNQRMMSGMFRMQEEELKLRRKEQKWNQWRFAIFVIPSFIAILGWITVGLITQGKNWVGEYVAFVDLRGSISESGPISARRAIAGLNGAFSDERAKGILIRISSPGGGATQSALIRDFIDKKKAEICEKKETCKKVVVVGEDVLASGAYLIASGADDIWVHSTTLTGSIGVVVEGWGLEHVIEKVGLEHRQFTAGEFKRRLSPFEPVNEEDREKMEAMVQKTHDKFIAYVERGRGDRITGDKKILFSGDVFHGDEAHEYGLVDHLGSVNDAMEAEFDTDRARDFSFKDPWYVQASQQTVNMVLDWAQPKLQF